MRIFILNCDRTVVVCCFFTRLFVYSASAVKTGKKKHKL